MGHLVCSELKCLGALSPSVAMEGSKRQVSDWKEVKLRKHVSRSNVNDGQQEHIQK